MKKYLVLIFFYFPFGSFAQEDAVTLYITAKDYFLKGDFEKGLPLAEKAVQKAKIEIGETTSDYGTIINLLGLYYIKTQQYANAEPLFVQARMIKQKFEGEENADYITITENLVWVYLRLQKYSKAEPLYLELKNIKKKLLGDDDLSYAAAINDLGVLYFYMGQYAKSEPLIIQSAEIRKRKLGENDPDYATSLNILAAIFSQTGYYEKSELLYNQSAAIQKKVLGEYDQEYANTLSNYAALCEELGQYEKAVNMLIQAKNIYAKSPGIYSPEYATALNNLGACYLYMSRYDKAEPLLLETKELRKKILGEKSPAYAISLNNLAQLYTEMGQFEKATPYYLQTIETRKATLGETHPEYVTSLSNYGLFLYRYGNNLKDAISLCTEAALKRKEIFGETSTDYAISLNNLAMLYKESSQFTKSESNYLQAAAIIKKIQGENVPIYATTISNLAILYSDAGQFKKAEPLLLQVKAIRKKLLGEWHRDYATSLVNLASNYAEMGFFAEAEPLYLQSNKILQTNMLETFSVLSEKEKMNYLQNDFSVTEYNNNFLYHYPGASSAFIRNNFDLQLFFKSLLLTDTKNMLNVVRNSSDTTIRKLFTDWQTNRSILTKQYALSSGDRRSDLKQLELQTEDMERELNRRSAAFRNQSEALRISSIEVQKKLKPDEAAIEFVHFKLFSNNRWTDTIVYAAYVLKKNDSIPDFIILCHDSQLQQLFDSAGKTATSMVNSFYRGIDIGTTAPISLGKELYKLLWAPLEPSLKEVKKIFYSPSGKLFSVAFHAMPIDTNLVLMDKYQLSQLTSTRQLALTNNSIKNQLPASITLFGDPDYSLRIGDIVNQNKEPVNPVKNGSPKKRGEGTEWMPLPGTADEVKKINELFLSNKKSSSVYLQKSATEENFKKQNNKSSQILHIATHGFFLSVEKARTMKESMGGNSNSYIASDDPLLRSGLILAGGNNAWRGKTVTDEKEDGIVTAYEIAQLDLSHTELMVLSACETALGDVKGSEGVFGLQRAFKMAGVKKMIVSLWQVPDKETAELMTTFYGYWLKGKTIEDSFAQAQADMRKKYSPYYWAAFVLIE